MTDSLGESKVTRNFQVTIPEEARKFLKVKKGDFVVFLIDKETQKVYLKRAKLVF